MMSARTALLVLVGAMLLQILMSILVVWLFR